MSKTIVNGFYLLLTYTPRDSETASSMLNFTSGYEKKSPNICLTIIIGIYYALPWSFAWLQIPHVLLLILLEFQPLRGCSGSNER